MIILEYAFYIHGVMSDLTNKTHEDNYSQLHEGISKFLQNEPWPTLKGGAEWGWQTDDTKRKSHHVLAKAQEVFGGKVLNNLRDDWEFTWNPFRGAVNLMRETMMHGFGDMFYYVSTEGKWAVRNAVAAQLREHIEKSLPEDRAISLTLFGHSAGSVIAFDLLYYLFMKPKDFKKLSWINERGIRSKQSSEEDSDEIEKLNDNFEYLHKLIHEEKRFRLRMLVTFGSPISMLMYRSDKLIEILASGDTLTPEQYGLTSEIKNNPLSSNKPRWLNIWDKDDPISWPISPVMGNHDLVKDERINVSSSVVAVHNQYWKNKKIHKLIANHWKALNQ